MSLITVSIVAYFDEQGMSNHPWILLTSLYVKYYHSDVRVVHLL